MEFEDGLIEEWTFTPGGKLYGYIYYDSKKRFKDGVFIKTSTVVNSIFGHKEGDIIITKNSKYVLGVEAE